MQVGATEAPVDDKVNQHGPVAVRSSSAAVVVEDAPICTAFVVAVTLAVGHRHDAAKVEVAAVVRCAPARLPAAMAQHTRLEARPI